MVEEIKKALSELEAFEHAADVTEEFYEKNPEDKACEKAFDEAYKMQFKYFMKLATIISQYTGMTEKEAREVINRKRNELKKLIA